MRRAVFLAAAVVLLQVPACTWFTGWSPTATSAEVYVSVTGPRDWLPATDYTLEIGRIAYRVDASSGGGVASVPVASNVGVRLVRTADCVTLVTFGAQPGSGWTIRFDAQERLTLVRLRDDQVRLLGPALVEGQLSGCPLPNPPTS